MLLGSSSRPQPELPSPPAAPARGCTWRLSTRDPQHWSLLPFSGVHCPERLLRVTLRVCIRPVCMCFNMSRGEIKPREARHSPRLTGITPANLLNGKNVMQYKRNLSNSKAFTQLRKFKIYRNTRSRCGSSRRWDRLAATPGRRREDEGQVGGRRGPAFES